MRHPTHVVAALVLVNLAAGGCERDLGGLQPAPPIIDPLVFDDDFGDGVIFHAFLNSKLDAATVDVSQRYAGSAALKIAVPAPGHPVEWFSGGAVTTDLQRDLSTYDALTFWARASAPVTLDVAGLGNDNTGTSKYEASWSDIDLTPTWKQYIVPIPLPEKLDHEGGLFYFAEGHENQQDYEIWFDEVRFEKLDPGTITNPRPFMTASPLPVSTFVGETVTPEGTGVILNVGGIDQTLAAAPGYFTWTSSDETVAKSIDDEIRILGPGSATLTAELLGVAVPGTLRLTASIPPMSTAPRPTHPAGDVVSLFSNAYSNQPVENWLAFGSAAVTDLQIAGDDVKVYTNLSFAGISFANPTVDASSMTHFHLDIWVPNAAIFKTKLVDFGADGRFGGTFENRDTEHELSFNAATTPPLQNGAWVSLDIPLADFTGLQSTAHLAQLIISITAVERTVFLDNFYFHR